MFKIKNPLFWSIGLRYSGAFGSNKFASFVSTMSVIGVCLGVAALIVVISVMNGLEGNMKDRVLSVVSHAVVTDNTGVINPDDVLYNRLKQEEHVTNVSPIIETEAIIQSHKKLTAVSLKAVDVNSYPKHDLIRDSMYKDLFSVLANEPYTIIIGIYLARDLDIAPGESVRLIFPRGAKYTLAGKIPAQRLFKYVGSFSSGVDVDKYVALINLGDAQKIMRLGNKISGYRVWLTDPFLIDNFKNSVNLSNKEIKDWRVEKGDLFNAIALEKKMMSLMLFLIIFVAIFNILSSLIMLVMDKTKEVSILRTMGMQSHHIMYIFVVQGMICGVVGTISGLLLGMGCANYINEILNGLGVADKFLFGQSLPVIIQPIQIILIVLCSLLLTGISTIYPSYRASKVLPAEALRYE